MGGAIIQTVTEQVYGLEFTVHCEPCTYTRHWGSGRAADNDQITHVCTPDVTPNIYL